MSKQNRVKVFLRSAYGGGRVKIVSIQGERYVCEVITAMDTIRVAVKVTGKRVGWA